MKSTLTLILASLALAQFSPSALSQSSLHKIDLMPAVPLDSWPGGAMESGDPGKPGPMVEFGGEFYFTAYHSATGRELYKTNGQVGGTQLVHDFAPGPNSSNIGEMAVVGGRLYLVAYDPSAGLELWSTGGTSATTQREFDLNPGVPGSNPKWLTAVGTKLYFIASIPGAGTELFVLDTTQGGSPLLIDIFPGSHGSEAREVIAHPSGVGVLLEANGSFSNGSEIWTSDGTTAGTSLLADISPGPGHGTFRNAVTFAGGVLFSAVSDVLGGEPFFTDGTALGTVPLGDIAPGLDFSGPIFFPESEVGGVLYFAAQNAATGRELYQTDGTPAGTFLVADAVPGPGSSFPTPIGIAGGKLIVHSAVDLAGPGAELYTLEPGGLVLLKDMAPGSSESGPNGTTILDVAKVGGKLFIGAQTPPQAPTLWVTDGTPLGTILVSQMAGNLLLSPRSLTAISSTTAIFGGADSIIGSELFRSGGTPASTYGIADIDSGMQEVSSDLINLSCVDGEDIFFNHGGFVGTFSHWSEGGGLQFLKEGSIAPTIQSEWHGDRSDTLFNDFSIPSLGVYSPLMLTDGTSAGTSTISNPGASLLGSTLLFGSDGLRTLFVGQDEASGSELWSTDGTTSGTQMIVDLNPSGDGVSPLSRKASLTSGFHFFEGTDGSTSTALWKTDGTAAGTSLVKDIAPGRDDSISSMTVFQDLVLLTVDDGVHGLELWVSDGTQAGTTLLRDIVAGADGTFFWSFTEYQGSMYFTARESVADKSDLWVTDGTPGGTQLAADIAATAGNFGGGLVEAGGLLFFDSEDAGHGRELWKFDGTSASLVADLIPGPDSGGVQELVACGSRVYFVAETLATGVELFVSDGTAAGTHVAVDLKLGPESGTPAELTLCGGDLFFVGTGPDNDRELYRLTRPGAHVLDLGFGASGAQLTATPPALGSAITVTVEDAPLGDVGALLLSGPTEANAAFANLGNASWMDPQTVKLLSVGTTPTWSYAANLPGSAAFLGINLHLQAWFLNPVSLGATTSNGLRLELGF